jgi:rhodanese-related sulfurtransferase/uncharacterized membrane protein YedE/YeeE
MYPFPLTAFTVTSAENPWTYVVFLVIGFFFGYVLETAGFGNSKKLAAQFYFSDLTVLKVMFGAIVTAMVLLFSGIGLGLVDYNLIYVNTTYLWPMILGGLIMGVGFIVGGFCPGTSLVSMTTGKIDGMFFVGGVLGGIFLFGETEKYYDQWWNTAGYMGRFTIMDWLNLPNGVVVTIIVAMALFMFWGAEQLERIFGKRDLAKEPKLRIAGAVALFAVAIFTIFVGVPSQQEKYSRVTITRNTAAEDVKLKYSADEALAAREMQISPAELFKTIYDQKTILHMIDVRSEADYNLYHIRGAVNIPLDELNSHIKTMLAEAKPNAVYVVMSNDETAATQAWKMLIAESVPNSYILDGGINNWIAFFGKDDPEIIGSNTAADDQLKYIFPAALGDKYESCDPSPIEYEKVEFTPKIQLQVKRDKSGGGCG